MKNQCDALEEKCKSHQLCRCPVGKPFFPAGLFVVLHLLHLLVDYGDEDAFRYEYEEPEYTYQINAGGRVALEEQKHFTKTERRANIALGLSVLSLLVAIATALKG